MWQDRLNTQRIRGRLLLWSPSWSLILNVLPGELYTGRVFYVLLLPEGRVPRTPSPCALSEAALRPSRMLGCVYLPNVTTISPYLAVPFWEPLAELFSKGPRVALRDT